MVLNKTAVLITCCAYSNIAMLYYEVLLKHQTNSKTFESLEPHQTTNVLVKHISSINLTKR